jgi:hypothetical protein
MPKSTTPIGHYNTVEEAEDALRRAGFKWDVRRDEVSHVVWFKGGVEQAMWRKKSGGTLLFNIRARTILAENDMKE